MTTDFRALAQELLAAIQLYTGLNPAASEMSPVEKTEKLMDAMAATVAALATLPPEPPKPSTERPNRLRAGDMWEFEMEVYVKGKQKPVDMLLQWEVIGWHNGQYAWELQSLDGEHKTYLMEFAPSYEEMRFIGTKKHD